MRMTDAEAVMWAVEKDPALRSDFCNLTILDRRPSDERLHETLERALAAIPRLRQRVVGAPLRIVPPDFDDDPTLDLDAHVRVVAVPPPADERALLDLCGALAEQPLDRARPLWEFTLIEGLVDGRCALLQRVHHVITDGEGGLRLSLALVDFERDPPNGDAPAVPELAPRHDSPVGVTRNALGDAVSRGAGAVKGAAAGTAGALANPRALPGRASDAARLAHSFRRQLFVTSSARSDVMTGRSLRKRFDTYVLPFPTIRAAASTLGGSVNDAFVTGLASALGRYHERFDSNVEELRLAMPVSTRIRGDRMATNAFAPARVLVPIQPAHDVAALFKTISERLGVAKQEQALGAAGGLAAFAAPLPTSWLVALTRSQTRTIDFAASNLRGSTVPLYLAGTRIIASYPFGPRTASALNVTMLSYVDELHLGFNIDPAAITDVEAFFAEVRDAYFDLASYA